VQQLRVPNGLLRRAGYLRYPPQRTCAGTAARAEVGYGDGFGALRKMLPEGFDGGKGRGTWRIDADNLGAGRVRCPPATNAGGKL
jgi:hypothetical protein